MNNYTLKENETVLYRGEAIVLPDGKSVGRNAKPYDVWLTNLNIVIFVTRKKMLKTMIEPEIYSVADVKVYDESMQIIRRKSVVDVYLKTGEIFLDFKKDKEAKSFCDKALRLTSGESKFVRAVKKGRKEIRETNEALDVDVVDLTVKGTKMGFKIAQEVGSLGGAGKKTKIIGIIGGTLFGKSKENNSEALPPAAEQTDVD
jgi:hypothetical protein